MIDDGKNCSHFLRRNSVRMKVYYLWTHTDSAITYTQIGSGGSSRKVRKLR